MAEWERWLDYPKHKPPAGCSAAEILFKTTRPRPSLYYPGVDIQALEEEAARNGLEVPSGKPATAYKIFDARRPIGAANGEETSVLRVESTNGVFHGHPITRLQYEKYLGRRS